MGVGHPWLRLRSGARPVAHPMGRRRHNNLSNIFERPVGPAFRAVQALFDL
jgi:hypothetical protein